MIAAIGSVPLSISPEMATLLDEIKAHRQRTDEWVDSAVAPESYIEQKRRQLKVLEKRDKFFFNHLITDETFSKNTHFETFAYCAPDLAIKCKRGAAFYTTLEQYFRIKDTRKYTASHQSMPKVLNDYISDLAIIKKRRGIDKVQFPKIAGLMANLIVKYRPIVPIDLNDDPKPDINENFAIFHAICICTDYAGGKEDMMAFQASDKEYRAFYKDVGYLLKRNFTPESLISVFKTLCLYQFPKALAEPASE